MGFVQWIFFLAAIHKVCCHPVIQGLMMSLPNLPAIPLVWVSSIGRVNLSLCQSAPLNLLQHSWIRQGITKPVNCFRFSWLAFSPVSTDASFLVGYIILIKS